MLSADLEEAVEEVLPALKEQEVHVFLLGENCQKNGLINLSEKISAESDEQLPRSLRSKVTMKTPAIYIYTSGTTGRTHTQKHAHTCTPRHTSVPES